MSTRFGLYLYPVRVLLEIESETYFSCNPPVFAPCSVLYKQGIMGCQRQAAQTLQYIFTWYRPSSSTTSIYFGEENFPAVPPV
jgi:hypothetical protein